MSICKFLSLLSGVVVVALLLAFGYFLVGRTAEDCPWISSFLEVCVAINGALVVTRVREWLSHKLVCYAQQLVDDSLDKATEIFDEQSAEMFATILNRVFDRFQTRLSKLETYAAYSGPIFAIASVVILLLSCDPGYFWVLILLASPFVVFYTCSYVCYKCTTVHLREIGYDVGLVGKTAKNDVGSLTEVTDRIKNLCASKGCAHKENNEGEAKSQRANIESELLN